MKKEISLNQVVKGISGIVEKILQVEVVKTDFNFNDGDFSKKHLLNELKETFNLKNDIPLQTLWEYPTIDLLADYIYAQLSGEQQSFKDLVVYENLSIHEPIAIVGIGCNFP